MASKETEFIWGISSSAPQTEGAALTDGRGLSIWDTFSKRRRKIAGRHTPETACDFYNRFESDLNLLQVLGIKHFRTSISWSRILPEGTGYINTIGLDFYDRLTDACLERGVSPWLTLYHWDLPHALEEKGGWTNRDIVNYYTDYCSLVLKRLGDRVHHWMALNEPLVFTGAGYFLGVHAPGRRGMDNFIPAMHHAALAQAAGIRIIRDQHAEMKAGTTFSCSWITPWSDHEKDIQAATRVDTLLNDLFLDTLYGQGYPLNTLPFLKSVDKYMKPGDEKLLVEKPDFIGIQNYTREVIRYSWLTPYVRARIINAKSRKVKHTQMNWEVYPDGLYLLLKKYAEKYSPASIIVTENGAAFNDHLHCDQIHDSDRINYLKEYTAGILKAREEGVNVKGYFAWSLTDNFEWAEGYFPRFGLVHVDYSNQKRTIKDSGYWYSEFIASHQQSKAENILSVISK